MRQRASAGRWLKCPLSVTWAWGTHTLDDALGGLKVVLGDTWKLSGGRDGRPLWD